MPSFCFCTYITRRDEVKKEEYAPFELEYFQQKGLEERTTFTRTQWKEKGRCVVVANEEARRAIVTRAGNTLHLFSFDQTEERTPRQRSRVNFREAA
jgi:hypothetical protein